jgi:ParB-like chromosome segregation protein Spo0J
MTGATPSNPAPSSGETIQAAAAAEAANALAKASGKKPGAARQEAPGILKRSNSYFADPAMITRREGFNARFDMGDIETLAAQIKAKKEQDPESGGLIHDIHVKRLVKGDYRLAQGFAFEVIDGDRRLTAIEHLMKKGLVFEIGVPVKIVNKEQSEVQDLIQMFVANEGKPFLPLEEAAAYQRLRDAGLTVKEICAAVSRSSVHVSAILALANADESLKQAVKDGKVNKMMARNIATNARGDKAKQAELTAAAVAAGSDKGAKRKVIREVEKAKQTKAVKKGAKRIPKMRALSDEELSALGASIAAHLPGLLQNAKAMMHQDDLEGWIKKDDKLVVAFTFGALQALKAAAGLKVKLEL